MTSTIKYLGDLRTECTHVRSGNTIITDAPVDNHGKGEAFSPTDLTATSLGTCMITIMALAARNHNLNVDNTFAEVTKHMNAEPRRIAGIDIKIIMPKNEYSDKEKKILEVAAKTCPVAFSLHPDVKVNVDFVW
jgi:putative redox protein